MTAEGLRKKFDTIKRRKLIGAIIIDFVGYLSYVIPSFWEFGDIFWVPISGIAIFMFFPNHKKMAIAGFVEESTPGLDFIPTACLTWHREYKKNSSKTWKKFLENEIQDERIFNEVINNYEIDYKEKLKQ